MLRLPAFLVAVTLVAPHSAQLANEDAVLVPDTVVAGARFGSACAIDGDRAVVGSCCIDTPVTDAGAAHVFERGLDGLWVEVAELVAPVSVERQTFGRSVDLDGDRAIVGTRHYDWSGPLGFAVDAHVYERQPDGTWAHAGVLTSNLALGSEVLNTQVAISGDHAIVGTYVTGDYNYAYGEAHGFLRQSDGTWIHTGVLSPPGGGHSGVFLANTVAIDGDLAVVGFDGGGGAGSQNGAAYVYELQEVVPSFEFWFYAGTLSSPATIASDSFGSSVSIDGDRVLVGARGYDGASSNSGAMFVFERQPGGAWLEVAALMSDDPATASLGRTVELAGDIAIGTGAAPTGADAIVFERQADGTWTETFGFAASNGVGLGGTDRALSLDGASVLFGASGDNTGAPGAGRAYSIALGTLQSGLPDLSIADGGTQDLLLRAGAEHASRNYLILGSASGTTPGFTQPGPPFLHIPLNPDAYSSLLLATGGAGVLLPGSGVLDADGFADSELTLPPGLLSPSFAGLTLHHAYVVFEAAGAIAFHHASNAVRVTLGV